MRPGTRLSRLAIFLLAAVPAGCGKRGPAVPAGAPAAGSAESEARALAGTGELAAAVQRLKGVQSGEALEILLPMLEKPGAANNFRRDAVAALAAWPGDHDRIADAFAKLLPSSRVDEFPAIAKALAAWGMKRHAAALARFLVASRDDDSFSVNPLVEPLAALATPECVPVLLEALPLEAAHGTSREAHDTVRRALPAIELLGRIGDWRAVPALVAYLDAGGTNATWRPASVALGRIGSGEAVAAIERRMAKAGDAEGRRPFLAGLLRARSRRDRLAEALAGKDLWDRVEAAAALAETAAPADAALVLGALDGPDPLLRQTLLPALPRLLPESRAALEAACDRWRAAERFQSAYAAAEALGDRARLDAVDGAWTPRREAALSGPRLDRWLGKSRADVLAEFPDAAVQAHVKVAETPEAIYWTDWGSTFDAPAGLSFWGGRDAQGPFVGASAWGPWREPAYGVRLGDPAAAAWELHGVSERENEGLWGRLVRRLPRGAGTIRVTWFYGDDNRIAAVEIRAER